MRYLLVCAVVINVVGVRARSVAQVQRGRPLPPRPRPCLPPTGHKTLVLWLFSYLIASTFHLFDIFGFTYYETK